MKNKIFSIILCSAIFLCGCTENTNTSVSSENKVYETVSTKETVSSVTKKETSAITSKNPVNAHTPNMDTIECDFVNMIKEENEIYADDGTAIYHADIEYPQILTDDEALNTKINNIFIEEKNSVLEGNSPLLDIDSIHKYYEEYNGTLSISYSSEVKFLDEKYISFRIYYMSMGSTAAHPNHAFTMYTFSLETGDLLNIEDIFNDDFCKFAEEYIIDDLTTFNQEYENQIISGDYKKKTAEKINNNEDWYLTEEGFALLFERYEIACYAVCEIESTIPWELIEEYLK